MEFRLNDPDSNINDDSESVIEDVEEDQESEIEDLAEKEDVETLFDEGLGMKGYQLQYFIENGCNEVNRVGLFNFSDDLDLKMLYDNFRVVCVVLPKIGDLENHWIALVPSSNDDENTGFYVLDSYGQTFQKMCIERRVKPKYVEYFYFTTLTDNVQSVLSNVCGYYVCNYIKLLTTIPTIDEFLISTRELFVPKTTSRLQDVSIVSLYNDVTTIKLFARFFDVPSGFANVLETIQGYRVVFRMPNSDFQLQSSHHLLLSEQFETLGR